MFAWDGIAIIDYDASNGVYYSPVNLEDPKILIRGGLDPIEADPRFHQQMVYAVITETIQHFEAALGRRIHWRRTIRRDNERLTAQDDIYTLNVSRTRWCRRMHSIALKLTVSCSDISGRTQPILDGTSQDRSSTRAFRTTSSCTKQLMRSSEPLLALSQDFGEAIGCAAGLRSALVASDPLVIQRVTDPVGRGAIVVAAVFDALFSIYQRRTLDLFRIFRAGGGRLQGNDVPEPLANRLCAEMERIASRVFNMCWRALDYCPGGEMELGDFLRACITADFEYSRGDPWGVRDAIMQAFRLRGIKSSSAMFFTEDALRWKQVDGSMLSAKGPAELS
jgi:hypothetical protein